MKSERKKRKPLKVLQCFLSGHCARFAPANVAVVVSHTCLARLGQGDKIELKSGPLGGALSSSAVEADDDDDDDDEEEEQI